MRPVASFLLALTCTAGVAAQLPPPPPPAPGMPQRDAAQPKTGTASLRGTVVSAETGRPLRRAQVRAVGADPRDARGVSTDEQGRWELKELPAGRYSIHVSKGGYVGLSYGQRRPFEQGRPVELADGQTIEKLDVALPRGSVIAGRLTDEFGEPVAGARVVAMRHRFAGGVRRLMPTTGMGASDTTDDLGQFRLHGLSPGDYYLSAALSSGISLERSDDRTGYLPTYYPGTPVIGEAQRITLAVGEQAGEVSFTLVPGRVASVSGRATDSSGKPIANSAVRLTTGDMTTGTPLAGMSMTRPDGSFTLSNIPPGEYQLQAEIIDAEALARVAATGSNAGMIASETASMPLTVSGDNITHVELVTAPAARLTGRVRFEGMPARDVPRAGIVVQALPGDPGVLRLGASVRVNDDWTIEGSGLAGRVLFRVTSPATGWHLKSVTVHGTDVTDTGLPLAAGQQVHDVELLLSRDLPSLTGSVHDGRGQPLTDYVVVAFADDPAKWGYMTRHVRTGRPNQSGHFRIEGLPAGSYLAVALEYLEPGDEQDPETLERLRGLATAVTIKDGEKKDVTLRRH